MAGSGPRGTGDEVCPGRVSYQGGERRKSACDDGGSGWRGTCSRPSGRGPQSKPPGGQGIEEDLWKREARDDEHGCEHGRVVPLPHTGREGKKRAGL
jgi:hypothetical protein